MAMVPGAPLYILPARRPDPDLKRRLEALAKALRTQTWDDLGATAT